MDILSYKWMNQEVAVDLHNGMLCISKEQNHQICCNMDGLREYFAKWS